MTNDSTASTNQAPVANSDDWISNALLTWNHPRRQRDIRTNQRICTDVDELLIEDCGRLPHDETPIAKGAESLSTRIGR
jgi:hypothetical protein